MPTEAATPRTGTRMGWVKALTFLTKFPTQVRLCWRLFRDPRVGIGPKALLVGALAYVALPTDVIPDVIPFLGQLDDVVIIATAARWFVRWCPTLVVHEHLTAITGRRLA